MQHGGEPGNVEGTVGHLVQLPAKVCHLAVKVPAGLLTLAQGVLSVLDERFPDQESHGNGAKQDKTVLEGRLHEQQTYGQGGEKHRHHNDYYSCCLGFHLRLKKESVPITSSGVALSTTSFKDLRIRLMPAEMSPPGPALEPPDEMYPSAYSMLMLQP